MGLFLVLFWYLAGFRWMYFTFKSATSRLGTLRELAYKCLIWLVLLTTEGRLRRRNRRISRHNGKNPEWDEAMLSTAVR
jgi:hypothetical protein